METKLQDSVCHAAQTVFRDTPIFLAYAYGSRVSGVPREDSDLDIGYYLTPNFTREHLPITEEMLLEEELTRAIGLSVDLRNLKSAPLEWRGRVLEEGIRVYCASEPERVALETALLARYHDYKPTLARMHQERLESFAAAGGHHG